MQGDTKNVTTILAYNFIKENKFNKTTINNDNMDL